MKSDTITPTDYARGYQDGIAHASIQIAKHYRELQQKSRKIETDVMAANRVLETMVLAELAPLQDRVNRLHPSEEADHG